MIAAHRASPSSPRSGPVYFVQQYRRSKVSNSRTSVHSALRPSRPRCTRESAGHGQLARSTTARRDGADDQVRVSRNGAQTKDVFAAVGHRPGPGLQSTTSERDGPTTGS
ncbi:hypothetical protein EXIGLDRAFT_736209 [Exidia glandulosa HHB12029]|uniref:Uncharacterized protein n=1 Tax=Exidia glandulosa HHB12029 TaxID=1314781 RepID=A0A166N9Z5_EXIGL|nr:hypothetical protein EXIGLDRAFT_736209 [Exidia glandulosa HHB12029]